MDSDTRGYTVGILFHLYDRRIKGKSVKDNERRLIIEKIRALQCQRADLKRKFPDYHILSMINDLEGRIEKLQTKKKILEDTVPESTALAIYRCLKREGII